MPVTITAFERSPDGGKGLAVTSKQQQEVNRARALIENLRI
jgi:hypothetical protein